MTQLSAVVEPFGEVNTYVTKDGVDIVATILMVPDIEGAKTGLAIDASVSMQKMFGVSGVVSPIFAKASAAPNIIEPVAKTMASYLAKFSAIGKVDMIYWAVGTDGSKIEEIGELDEAQITNISISGPKKEKMGRQTKLLPPVKYYIDKFGSKESKWSIAVIITDGVIEDVEEVKEYCFKYAEQIGKGKKSFVKLVLIGVGEECQRPESIEIMEGLDDMFEGSGIKDAKGEDIDIWDHKLAHEMKNLEEIFSEAVTENVIVAPTGKIINDKNVVVKEYSDGVPALLRFTLPKGSIGFSLVVGDTTIFQDIKEGL